MFYPFSRLFGKKPGNTLINEVSVIGIGNTVNNTINIYADHGAALGFEPRIGWNPSPQKGGGQAV